MTHHDVIDRASDVRASSNLDTPDLDTPDDVTAAFVDFLTAEFPEWQFGVDETSTWSGTEKQRWVATRVGHHPQSELTAGKLHRRLSDYEERLRARRPGDN